MQRERAALWPSSISSRRPDLDETRPGNLSDKLPAERELPRIYSVSRQTVRQALDKLLELGRIEKRRGSESRVLKRMEGRLVRKESG